MGDRLPNLKRKRENDYPRATFITPTRTFDRLLKEVTLDELKDGVRKKLGYASHVPLQLAQLRDGKAVDLEDEDDFEAFCSTAYSLSVITVQVTVPEDAPATPAKTPAPPPAMGSSTPEVQKKRKKKRKVLEREAEAEDLGQGQKRKAPVSDNEHADPESKESEPLPPKKKKTKKQATNEAPEVPTPIAIEPAKGSRPDHLPPPAPKNSADIAKSPTGTPLEKERDEGEAASEPKQPKSKKDKTRVAAEPVVRASGGAAAEQEDAVKPKKKKKKQKKDTDTGKEQADGSPIEQNDAPMSQESSPVSDEGSFKKPKRKTKGKANEQATDAIAAAPAPEAGKKKSGGKVPAAHKEKPSKEIPPTPEATNAGKKKPNGIAPTTSKQKSAKEIASTPFAASPSVNESSQAEPGSEDEVSKDIPAPAKNKKKLPLPNDTDAAKNIPQPQKEPGKQAFGTNGDSQAPRDDGNKINRVTKSKAVRKVVVAIDALKVPMSAAEQAAVRASLDKLVAEKKASAPKTKPIAEVNSSTSTASVVKKSAAESSNKSTIRPSDCQICGKTWHVRSRCGLVRGAVSTAIRTLAELKKENAVSRDEFRTLQIEGIEVILRQKGVEPNKVVSNEADIITDLGVETAKATANVRENVTAESRINDKPFPGHSSLPPKNGTSTISSRPPQPVLKPTEVDASSDTSSDDEPLNNRKISKTGFRISHPSTKSQPKASETSISELAAAINRAPIPEPISTPSTVKAVATHQHKSIPPSDEGAQSSKSRVASFHPAAAQTPAKFSKTKYRTVQSAEESSDESSAEPILASLLSPPPGSSTGLPESYNDVDLDALIRGPNITFSSKDLPTSDNSEDGAEEEHEDLVEDDGEKPRRAKKSAKVKDVDGSSDEEEHSDAGDGASDEVSGGEAPRRPPRLSIITNHETDESAPDSAFLHIDLSFGDVNRLASSVEIDPQGDRAFSEALADDTAVFNLAAGDEESPEPSRPATPGNATIKAATQSILHHQEDSIEPFDSPEKPLSRSPVNENDAIAQSTPRGLAGKMKGRKGSVAPTPASSMGKAIRLLDSVHKEQTKSGESSKEGSATRLVKAAASRAIPLVIPGRGMRVATAVLPESQAAKEPPSTMVQTRSQRTVSPGPSDSQVSKKPPSRTVQRFQKPVSQTAPQRTTRSTAKNPPTATQETQESEHAWQTLPALEYSSQYDGETMNMEDELVTEPEEDPENLLFIPSETQNSFPYSQWQGRQVESPHESEDEDEVENAIVGRHPASQKPAFGYTGLSHITSQRRSFRTSLPAAGPSMAVDRKKDTVEDLYGQTREDESEESGSSDSDDSDFDADRKAQKSHIPRSRRAGAKRFMA